MNFCGAVPCADSPPVCIAGEASLELSDGAGVRSVATADFISAPRVNALEPGEVLTAIVTSHEKVLKDPEPVVRLHNLGEWSVDFIVRPWVNKDDYWDVYWDVTRAVKIRFDEEDISIPFPQRDIHLYRGEQEPLATVIPTAIQPGAVEQEAVGWRGSKASEVPDADEGETTD